MSSCNLNYFTVILILLARQKQQVRTLFNQRIFGNRKGKPQCGWQAFPCAFFANLKDRQSMHTASFTLRHNATGTYILNNHWIAVLASSFASLFQVAVIYEALFVHWSPTSSVKVLQQKVSAYTFQQMSPPAVFFTCEASQEKWEGILNLHDILVAGSLRSTIFCNSILERKYIKISEKPNMIPLKKKK